MTRLEKFESFKSHPVHRRPLASLSKAELEVCKNFIRENDGKDKTEYAEAAARWMLDSPKPRHYSAMQALVVMANV